jgi:ATP-dependent helicase/nuclease subunit B
VLAQFGKDRMALAQGIILVPNNRAGQSIREAFVRQAQDGLLLPRLVAIGDPELGEKAGAAIDPIDDAPIPAAINPLDRQLMLARLIQQERAVGGDPVDAAEAMRLASDLANTLDQLIIEEKSAQDLLDLKLDGDLSTHWQTSLDLLGIILNQWPAVLAETGKIDLSDRRNRLLDRLAERWRVTPPPGFVIAAGISTAAPAIARVLHRVARLANGQVVLAGLDLHMNDEDWGALGGDDQAPSMEMHPQFHLWQLLSRMKVSRSDVAQWKWGSENDARAARGRAISHGFALPDSTRDWVDLPPAQRNLSGVTALTFATPADEAQGIALALREALEEPGQTAALVTPDRDMAVRVSAYLERWGIKADDSAGLKLTATPQGGLILALASAATEQFSPSTLLALLKHPLVRRGEARLPWLDQVRGLDLALRGPRPGGGLDGVSRFLAGGDERQQRVRLPVLPWWQDFAPELAELETAFAAQTSTLGAIMAVLRTTAQGLAGEDLWAGEAGRALSDLVSDLEAGSAIGPEDVTPDCVPQLLRHAMDAVSIRPGYGGHPRLFIWGLLEAKLQSAQFMILGGLNEGVWPQLPSPDPWLAPRIRKELGLPGLERRIGLSAHDLASALGAPKVLMTRARRDARSPTIASRFWLRLDTMTGGLAAPDVAYDAIARQLDQAGHQPRREPRPAPCPPVEDRPRVISVTDVDRLKADPYSFYAKAMLGLNELDAVDTDPGPAWRGSMIHNVIEDWAKQDDYAPGLLVRRMEAAWNDGTIHPLVRTLWLPRMSEAAQWIEDKIIEGRSEERKPLLAEASGKAVVAGVTLKGRADRIDLRPDGTIGIVDYKTGSAPSNRQVGDGFALQLGLIGLIAQAGGFDDLKRAAIANAFEYWSLSRDTRTRTFGKVSSPVTGKKPVCPPEDFVAKMQAEFESAAARWLTGDEPFKAKLHPDYAYGGYDQLMRLEEWQGRDG